MKNLKPSIFYFLLFIHLSLNAQNEFANYAIALRFWQNAIWQLPQDKQASFRDQLPEQTKKDLEAINAPYRNYQLHIGYSKGNYSAITLKIYSIKKYW